jgi:hypothetical protein
MKAADMKFPSSFLFDVYVMRLRICFEHKLFLVAPMILAADIRGTEMLRFPSRRKDLI